MSGNDPGSFSTANGGGQTPNPQQQSIRVTIRPFHYRGNVATIGQRFEEWLDCLTTL